MRGWSVMRGECQRQGTRIFRPETGGLRRKEPPAGAGSSSGRLRASADVALVRRALCVSWEALDPTRNLLMSSVLIAFNTSRSERQLGEQLRYSLLFK